MVLVPRFYLPDREGHFCQPSVHPSKVLDEGTRRFALSGISGSDPRQSIVIRVQTEEPDGAQ